jgi:tight adherence protein B
LTVTVVSVFFIVLITAFAVVALFTEPSAIDKQIHSRLASLDRKKPSVEDSESAIRADTTFSTIPALDRFLRNNRVATGLCLLIEQCDLQWTIGRVAFTTLMGICLGAVLGQWWIAPGLLGWAPGLVLGAAPYVFLRQKRKRRFRHISEQLPQAIDLMSGGLRAGLAVAATIETVADEVDDPLRSEFRRAAVEQSFGLPFREAMLNLRSRIPVPDLQFLVAAVLLQKETGGNLAQILDKTAYVIRERVRVEGEMRIRTAQGRLTGWILCAFPFVVFVGMNFVHPGYGKVLFEDPVGQTMVTVAGVMMVLGIFVIRRIVNVRM